VVALIVVESRKSGLIVAPCEKECIKLRI